MSGSGKLLNRVRELRTRLKLRQADLAAEVGVTRQTIIAIEKGRFNPSVLVSLKIARVLREPVDYVFYLAPGTEAEPVAAAESSQPKRVSKGKTRKTASSGPEDAAPPSAEEPVEVYDKAVKKAVASAETEPSQGETAPVEIAAEAPPAETPLSVAPSEPEMAEPIEDVESELEEEVEAETTAPSPVPLKSEQEPEEPRQEPEQKEASEPAHPAPSSPAEETAPEDAEEPQKSGGPKERETETGQAIWDFV